MNIDMDDDEEARLYERCRSRSSRGTRCERAEGHDGPHAANDFKAVWERRVDEP